MVSDAFENAASWKASIVNFYLFWNWSNLISITVIIILFIIRWYFDRKDCKLLPSKYFSNACRKQLWYLFSLNSLKKSNPLRQQFLHPFNPRVDRKTKSNHNRSDCSDFSHRLPPFNRCRPSGDGNSRAEFDWNLARGSEKERERENLQGSAFGYACSSNSRIEFSRCFRSFTVIVCHELSLEMVTLDFALWPGPMLQGEIFGSLPLSVSNIDSSSSRRFFEIRSISCIYHVRIDLSLLRCLKFVGDDLFIYNCTDWKIFADC